MIYALLGHSVKLKAVNMCCKLLQNERKLNFPYKKLRAVIYYCKQECEYQKKKKKSIKEENVKLFLLRI